MKRILASLLGCALLALPLAGMAGCGSTREVNEGMTQLYIGNYDGGVGRTWIETVARQFEEDYAETSFEEGKKGVQIWFSHLKDEYKSGNLLTTIQNYREDIYFLDSIVYEDFVSQNRLLDISDVLLTPNELDDPVNGEYPTIAEKTDPSRLALYEYTEDTYYAMPFFDHILGIVYDVDLFENEKLYNDGDGPDGLPDTYDDGLPRTYAEFRQLLTTMKQKGITPFTWCGGDGGYRIDLLTQVWMRYEGYDNFMLNNTFNGVYTFPAGTLSAEEVSEWNATVNTDGTQTVTITEENGYLLQKQQGKLTALQFAKDILSDTANYSGAGFHTSQMHTDAQEEYLMSVRRPRGTNQIAMLIEGSWWENEAKPLFNDMAEAYNTATRKYGYGERRFGFMPLPVFDGGSTDNTVYMGRGTSAIVVSAKTSLPELCKLFLKYVHTNDALAYFNAETGVTRPYDYTMTDEQYGRLTYYGQTLRDLKTSENVKLVYATTADSTIRSKDSTFFGDWMWGTTVNGNPYSDPFLAFFDSDMSAQDYFDGLSATYSKNSWAKQYAERAANVYVRSTVS